MERKKEKLRKKEIFLRNFNLNTHEVFPTHPVFL